MKKCTKCGIEKPETSFGKHTNIKTRPDCKSCVKARNAQKYLEKRQEILAKTKAWQVANQDKVKFNRKAWYQANKARLTAKNIANRRKHRHTNKAKLVLALEKSLRRASAYRAKQMLGCSIEELEAFLLAAHPGAALGREFSVDHIIPLSAWDMTCEDEMKASVHWTNLQLLPLSDNSKKGGANVTSKDLWRAAIAERLLVLRALDMV